MGPWIFGAAVALVSLLGLFMASYATDPVFHGTGLALFVAGMLLIGWLIRRGTGARDDA